jgi:predicted flap endonuclease-1-like 5' DNA nuclease
MWFLLLQIFILMLLAAALGAALMWWWLSRRHASIVESRERLLAQANRFDSLATRDDVAKQGASVLAALAGQKPVDLAPLDDTLQSIRRVVADIRMPETDLSPVQDRIDAVEARLAAFSLDPVLASVSDVGSAVSQVRPALEERLGRLEAALDKLKDVDLGPVHSGLASLGLTVNALEPKLSDLGLRLETSRRNDMDAISGRFAAISTAIGAVRSPDLAPLQQRLSEVHAAVANIRVPDVAPIQTRLGEVQASIANMPQPNLQPLQASLADLEAFVVALDKPPQDLSPLFNRMSALDSALAGLQADVRDAQALKPIDRRLAGIEEAIGSMPGPDLSPVVGAVRAIDNRREYGLAAVHHMLRSRADALAQRADGSDVRMAPPLHVVRQPEQQPAPARPEREIDPINAFRRANDEANLLSEPAFGPPDDLEAIDGVGPMLRALLHDLGVYYFWQVAEWTTQEIDWVESKLMHFRGRIRRDDWVRHARVLAAAPTAVKRPGQVALRRHMHVEAFHFRFWLGAQAHEIASEFHDAEGHGCGPGDHSQHALRLHP